MLERMQAGDWLCSYRDVEGIAVALRRIGARFRWPFDLAPAVAVLERDHDALRADFAAFFPELVTHVSTCPPSYGKA